MVRMPWAGLLLVAIENAQKGGCRALSHPYVPELPRYEGVDATIAIILRLI
jgi:hypothetical protein